MPLLMRKRMIGRRPDRRNIGSTQKVKKDEPVHQNTTATGTLVRGPTKDNVWRFRL